MAIDRKLLERREEILQITARYGAKDVRVFGSWARGDARPGSDLDLLINLEPGRTLLDMVAIKQDVEGILGCKVDVVTESAISPYIRPQVVSEAVAL